MSGSRKQDIYNEDISGVSRFIVDIFISISAVFTALFVFTISFFILHARRGERLTALEEVAGFITSLDVSAQQTAFRLSLLVIGLIWLMLIFCGDQFRRIIAGRSLHLLELLQPCFVFFTWFGCTERLYSRIRKSVCGDHFDLCFVWRSILAVVIIIVLYGILFSVRFGPILSADKASIVMASDPHSYVIFARAGEIILGSFSGNGTPEFYGPGGSFLYCGLRLLGQPSNYHTYLILIRAGNFLTMIGFIVCLASYWRSIELDSSSILFLSILVLLLVIDRFFADDGVQYFANLSGLRYLPVICMLIVFCCTRVFESRSSDFIGSMLVGAAIALFPDTGILSAIGLLAFICVRASNIRAVFGIVAVNILIISVTTLIVSEFIRRVSSYRGAGLSELMAQTDGGFSGIIVGWDGKMLMIVSIALFVSTMIIALTGFGRNFHSRGDMAINRSDAIAFASAMMILAWVPYYLHRPWDYLIFSVLLLFPISWMMGVTPEIPRQFRRGAVFFTTIMLVVFVAPYRQNVLSEIKGDIDRLIPAEFEPFSGLMLPRELAVRMTQRLSDLDKIRTADSIVVTGTPSAVAMSSGAVRAPVEALFTLGRKHDLDEFIRRIKLERPSAVIFDGQENPSWGANAIAAIVARIEAEISPDYRRVESSPYWRVWKPGDETIK